MNDEKQASSIIAGGPMAPEPDSPVQVVDVQFKPGSGSKVYFFDPGDLVLEAGNHVIIETTRGPEYGYCASGNHEVPFRDIIPPLRKVLRIATDADNRMLAANKAKEKRAFDICQQKIAEHKLDMQLVSAEYAFDGSKILFFFTADDRVDFRELVKNLAGIFRTRIELRQIGVRDKAKMVGGLGICGRPFCCAQFLEDFQPVSIKMAKTQNLSLNPTKISGTCGRLMCCLKYEQEAYEDLLKTSPKLESFVDTPDGRGTVTEVNLLRQTVKVRMEKQPECVNTCKNCELCVLRNGKAKKNDPPIPEDLAPISGGGIRPKQEEKVEEAPMLDPIRFRYRADDIVEEKPEQEPKSEDRWKRKPAEDDAKPEFRRTPKPPRPQKPRPERPQNPENAKPRPDRPQSPEGEQPKKEWKPRGPKPPRPQKPRPERPQNPENAKPRPDRPQGENRPEKPQTGDKPQGDKRPHNNYRRRPNNFRPRKPQEGGKPENKAPKAD